jgi:hypothetical protein
MSRVRSTGAFAETCTRPIAIHVATVGSTVSLKRPIPMNHRFISPLLFAASLFSCASSAPPRVSQNPLVCPVCPACSLATATSSAPDATSIAVIQPTPPLADAGVVTASTPEVPSRFAGETITAIVREVAIYFQPQVDPHWRGYLRAGGTARVVRGPLGNDNCPARPDRQDTGWYEIEGGGFICASRGAVLTRHLSREMRARLIGAPDLDAGLPYHYGLAFGPAIMYRSVPTQAVESATEPERFAPPAARARMRNSALAVTPGGRPATVEDLTSGENTPILRRLARGMYVSIDRMVRAESGATFTRTNSNGYVRTALLQTVRSHGFHGVDLSQQPLPVAFVISDVAMLRRLGEDGGMYQILRAPRMSTFPLMADDMTLERRGETFVRTRDGKFLKSTEVSVAVAHAPPADLAPGEKWIEVNLDRQLLIAYEGSTPVYAAVVASGVGSATDPNSNYETIQGSFRIQQKHIATTMDGNTPNGAYSIEDVPWAMYFEQSFALHGAYWHNGFGTPRSHGCVNLIPEDARWIFHWSSPSVPAGWHGAFATERDPGTRVYVHYERQNLGDTGGPTTIPGH